MKEKLLWAIGIAALGLAVAYGQRTPSRVDPQSRVQYGRYQLVPGPTPSAAAGDPQFGGQLQDLHRIDTETGKTWVYALSAPMPDGRHGVWSYIPEFTELKK
jgi:hypothetical protein